MFVWFVSSKGQTRQNSRAKYNTCAASGQSTHGEKSRAADTETQQSCGVSFVTLSILFHRTDSNWSHNSFKDIDWSALLVKQSSSLYDLR